MGIAKALEAAEVDNSLLQRLEASAKLHLSDEELHAQLISFIIGSGSDGLTREEIEEILRGVRSARTIPTHKK